MSRLRPYQVEPADRLEAILRVGSAGDFSDMGTGKTYVACEMIRRLDEPTLVVCPKISVSGWLEVGRQMGAEFSIVHYDMLRTGRTPYVEQQVMRTQVRQVLQVDGTVKEVRKKHVRFEWAREVKRIIFDEAHRCAGFPDTLQSRLLSSAVAQGKRPLVMTGSCADSPLQLKALGYALGLHRLENFIPWALQHGCYKAPVGGYKFTTSPERSAYFMDLINGSIFPSRAIRIRKTDMGDFYAGRRVECPLIDIEETSEANDLALEISAALAELEQKVADRPVQEANPMTRLLRARQRLAMLTLPAKVEMARDYLQQGRTVLFFENFSAPLQALRKAFPEFGVIDGSTPEDERRRVMAEVQADRMPGAVLNQKSGGLSISLHDLFGNRPRVSIVDYDYDARGLLQVFSRADRSGAKTESLVLMPLVAGTVHEQIKKAVDRKQLCIETLNDGDLRV